jgi:hypothetical protein
MEVDEAREENRIGQLTAILALKIFAGGGDAPAINRHLAGTIQTRARTNNPARSNDALVHPQA